jgi:UDP-N-acetylmuramate: L-alanyl-gamma-D-glutamyl-meso-diaminopimelate ligase
VFEPRSNTTRRKVFQSELAAALAEADCVVVAQVARLEQLPVEERLDPARLMQDIASAGRPAAYLAEVEAIVHHVRGQALPGDVVCVFSNGGFGGIHAKLLA